QKLDYKNIPNYSEIFDYLKNPEYDKSGEYSVPYAWGVVGIIYDKTKVKDDVGSFNILWDKKYKGQILMFDNPRDALGIALKRRGYSFNTTDENELKQAAKDLSEQKQYVQAYVMDQIFDKMENGDALIAPYYAGDFITMKQTNENLAFSLPREGTNRFVDAMCVPKGCTHKKEAEEFINFMTRSDVAGKNIEAIGYSTPSKSVYEKLPEDVKKSVSYPPEEILSKCETYTNLPQKTLDLYDKLWIDIFK
ncbi:MAG: spermidine/putrescine ABC transporter substrate-binding protein, partial [Bacillota bacterium]|nr:spermidine/putrescine ABC transporter substrate-binding protein [Bacillota bacterium]